MTISSNGTQQGNLVGATISSNGAHQGNLVGSLISSNGTHQGNFVGATYVMTQGILPGNLVGVSYDILINLIALQYVTPIIMQSCNLYGHYEV